MNNPSAFPIPDNQRADGMTLRDYFAAKALQGICSDGEYWGGDDNAKVKWAYEMADAMLAEREKTK